MPWIDNLLAKNDDRGYALFHCRYSLTRAFCIAFTFTFFSMFDVPVFWPILLFYWLVLFVSTMKRQIMHMIKYRYVPFSFGKRVTTKSLFWIYFNFYIRKQYLFFHLSLLRLDFSCDQDLLIFFAEIHGKESSCGRWCSQW